MNASIANPDVATLMRLATDIYTLLFAGREDVPGMPREEQLAEYDYDLLHWAMRAGLGGDLINRLARFYKLPFYPINQPHPTQAAQATLDIWRQSVPVKPATGYPWLPLHVYGPFLVVGHFAPGSTDLSGLPASLCIKVLISRADYDTVRDGSISTLFSELSGPVIPNAQSLSVVDLLTEVRRASDATADVETLRATFAKDPVVTLVETLRQDQVMAIPFDALAIDEHTMGAIPREIAVREPALCYAVVGTTYYVLMPRPEHAGNIQDEVNQKLEEATSSVRVVGVYGEEASLRTVLERDTRALTDLTGGGRAAETVVGRSVMTLDVARLSGVTKTELLQESNANLFADWLVYRALALQASDIHIERVDTEARVRYRVNGALIEAAYLPLSQLPNVLNVVKIYCQMPIVEKRKVLDGSFPIVFGKKRIDARVSMLPHLGELSCVIRLASKGSDKFSIDGLNLTPRNHYMLMEAASVRTGIVFITGPTGSGKTTTLYALLNHLNTPDRNIVTLEEPIEYHIPGIKQFQVNRAAELGFTELWRGVLRHDPNVILIGEIRDRETARQAITAAHTGHLVLTTLHTNDAPSVVHRLEGLGIEPAELADALTLVQAQRLVRIVCPHCSRARPPIPSEAALFRRVHMPVPTVVRESNPNGCRVCHESGFIRRQAVMEMMPATQEFVDKIIAQAPRSKLIETQRAIGFRNLLEEGLLLVAEGLTTVEEAVGWKRAFNDFDQSPHALPLHKLDSAA